MSEKHKVSEEDSLDSTAEVQNKFENLPVDPLIERLHERTAESIESFDINTPGLALHATKSANLESILSRGLGTIDHNGKEVNIDVCYNIVGAPVLDGVVSVVDSRGYNSLDRDIVLETDIFAKIFPNNVNVALSHNNETDGCFEQVRVDAGVKDEYDPKIIFPTRRNKVDTGKFTHNKNTLIPGFEPEILEDDGTLDYPCTEWGLSESDRLAIYKKLLSRNTINAIVIKDIAHGMGHVAYDVDKDSVLSKIIEIQDRLMIPKNEQIPVFDQRGKCLYNPLRP